jgi:hypothetical protein
MASRSNTVHHPVCGDVPCHPVLGPSGTAGSAPTTRNLLCGSDRPAALSDAVGRLPYTRERFEQDDPFAPEDALDGLIEGCRVVPVEPGCELRDQAAPRERLTFGEDAARSEEVVGEPLDVIVRQLAQRRWLTQPVAPGAGPEIPVGPGVTPGGAGPETAMA